MTAPARVLVCIPTYDERASLPRTLARLRAAVPFADVLVIDDGSPDGTGELAESLAAQDPQVRVLHRSAKQGLGAAYVAGFRVALADRYDVVVEMDADGSHAPEELPRLLAAVAGGADLALGSRWVPGGRVEDWPWSRVALSRGGNTYARLALGVGLRDLTGGYRAFRAPLLERLLEADVESAGYCFQVDLAWRALRSGADVREVPITFVERAAGTSKMSGAIVREALLLVTRWGLRRLLRGERLPQREHAAASAR